MALTYLAAWPLHVAMRADVIDDDSVGRALWVSRTIESNALGRVLTANLGFHIEHHIAPHVGRLELPGYARALRPFLVEQAQARGMPVQIHAGFVQWYVQYLRAWTATNEAHDALSFTQQNARFDVVTETNARVG
jgi:fatty acid desaturase